MKLLYFLICCAILFGVNGFVMFIDVTDRIKQKKWKIGGYLALLFGAVVFVLMIIGLVMPYAN